MGAGALPCWDLHTSSETQTNPEEPSRPNAQVTVPRPSFIRVLSFNVYVMNTSDFTEFLLG